MKQILSIVILSGLFIGCGKNNSGTATYEFRTGLDGKLLWRCNRFTGDVEFCRYGDLAVVWTRVKNADAKKQLTDVEVFGEDGQKPKGFVPETK